MHSADHPSHERFPSFATQKILRRQNERQYLSDLDRILGTLPSKHPPEKVPTLELSRSTQSNRYDDANRPMSKTSSCSCVCRHFGSKQFDCSLAFRSSLAETRPVHSPADDHPKRCEHCRNFSDNNVLPYRRKRHCLPQFAIYPNYLSFVSVMT